MKLVKIIIQHILIPLFTALFVIVVGLSSAGISGLIEYCVFREMFTSDYLQFIPSASIALILVVVLEFTKIYLHFLCEKLGPGSEASIKQHAKWLLPFLVAISVMCTIIFGVNTFHLASYDPVATEAKIESINDTLEKDIEAATEHSYLEYKTALAPFAASKTSAEEALADCTPDGLTRSQYETKLAILQEAANTATEAYTKNESELYARYETTISNETARLQTEAKNKIRILEDTTSPEIAAKYDNPIIANFLTVLAQTFFHATSYSRSVYLVVTIAFSIVIALLLEFIISICFSFLSFPFDQLIDTENPITPHLQKWCNNLVLTSLKSFCAVFISVIITMIATANMDKLQFLTALISCTISIMLIQNFVSVKGTSQAPSSQFIYVIRDSLLEGVISFMGFVILGFFFGKEALTLDISAIAIGIGTTLSSCVGYVPKYLIENIDRFRTSSP